MYELAILGIFPGAIAFAGAMDLFTMTIPNKISLALIASFIVLAPFVGLGWTELAMHLAAGTVILLFSFTMFALGWIGGGDAKIFAVGALWLGFDHLLEFTVYATLIGGILAVGLLLMRRMVFPEWLFRQDWFGRLYHQDAGMPYGVALAASALIIYPNTLWIASLY